MDYLYDRTDHFIVHQTMHLLPRTRIQERKTVTLDMGHGTYNYGVSGSNLDLLLVWLDPGCVSTGQHSLCMMVAGCLGYQWSP